MIAKRSSMTSTIAIMAMVTAAIMMEPVGQSTAQEGPRNRDRAQRAGGEPDTLSSARPAVGLGDRLKVTFFESLEVGGQGTERGAGGSNASLQTFYQRMDLSGEYSIEQDGTLSLPRLGRFMLEGRSLQDVQSELAVAFTRVMGRPADVNVTILERPPVYVVGPVKQPGAYKFVPGMMVLQVVALAGGLEQGLRGTSQAIEAFREMDRIRKTADDMKRLLARRARLDAESDGLLSLQPPEQLIGLAGERAANVYLDSENALLRVERGQKQQQLNEVNLQVHLAQKEIQSLRSKLTQLDVQRDIRTERLNDMQKLMSRGMTTRGGLINVRSELADIESRRQDHLFAIMQAEGRLAMAEQTKARFVADNAANLVRAIATTESEIMDLQQSRTSGEMLTAIIEDNNARLLLTRASAAPAYEIVRQGRGGPTVLSAQETSSLLPGDVLKINVAVTTTTPSRGNSTGLGRQTKLQTPGNTLR